MAKKIPLSSPPKTWKIVESVPEKRSELAAPRSLTDSEVAMAVLNADDTLVVVFDNQGRIEHLTVPARS